MIKKLSGLGLIVGMLFCLFGCTQPEEKSENSCTVTIRCDSVLENMELLAEEKHELIPEDGIMLKKEVGFSEGENVLEVLKRALQEEKIHFEVSSDDTYIKGIGNLYGFDCGPESGWLYEVNGASPEVGCKDYILSDGDLVEWIYTCSFS